ncbi:NB-ARC - like 10 [Theobroma cacao]|nr:NB-ARC - like 10 [Theobroma cacao]
MFNYKMMSEIKEIMRRLEDLAARKSNLQLREIDVGRPMPIPKSSFCEFDVIKITKTILQLVTSESCDINYLNLLQVRLKEKLSRKKFLLVLDDVKNENYDDSMKLRSPFDAEVPRSKIIVTTRSSNVSSIMRTVADYSLQISSDDDSLSTLAHHALESGDFTGHPDLKKIGLEIVKKCGGLPLAIKVIGGLLRTRVNHDAWNYILKSDIWNLLEDKSNIIPALWLSYYYLSSQLKQCFAYCSLLPKDHEFKEEIVLLWMAEGFLNEANTKREIEDLGSKYFEELVSRSFFQASSKNKSQFVMHDLITDLAQSIVGEIYFKRARHDDMKGSVSHTRYSPYIISKYDGIKKFASFSEAKSLQTYLPFEMMMSQYSRCYLSNNVLNHLLSALKCVRVLSLKRYYITEIPSSIGNLKHLYYPDFSYTKIKSLPDSIYSLYNLETLLLRFCENFEKLSLKLGILDNLCHLDITGGNSIEEMPSGIGKLKNLQVLSNFIVGQGDGLNIREMGNLSNLKDQLCIFELHNVDEAQYAWEAKLSIKPDLENLELKWSRGFNENLRRKEVEKEVLNSLQPHKDIKELAVK